MAWLCSFVSARAGYPTQLLARNTRRQDCLGYENTNHTLFVLHTNLQGFGQVARPAPRGLKNLLPATKAVGNKKRVPGIFSPARKEHPSPHSLRPRILILLKPKGARHSAAAGID